MQPLSAAILGQDPEKPAPKSLGELAKATGRGKDVKKVTIVGGGGGVGDAAKQPGPKHGDRYPYDYTDDMKTKVWDAGKKAWVARGMLGPAPSRTIIEK